MDPLSLRFLEELDKARLWNGRAVPEGLQFRLVGEYHRLQWIQGQIDEVKQERQQLLDESDADGVENVRQLLLLKGIGIDSAWLMTTELFAWRPYRNRKQAASLVGLTPTPYDSGERSREQGISKTGNRRVRAVLIEIAWSWVRYQPDSQLSQWYQKRFAQGGSRQRRIGIVAVARKLLIDLWRYVEFGIVPEGAVFSS